MDTQAASWRSHPLTTTCRPRLLVVDDAEQSRRALAEYFLTRGYEVSLAADGAQAMAQSLTRGVDVVIMKARLPGLEGFEAAAILRKITPRIHVILTMGTEVEGPPPERQRTERFRCFPTPLNLAEIAEAVEAAWAGEPVPEAEREAEDAG